MQTIHLKLNIALQEPYKLYNLICRPISTRILQRLSQDFSKIKQNRKEEFADTTGVIRICISKNRRHNGKKNKYKNTKHTNNTMTKRKKINIDMQTIHLKLNIALQEPH
jgi:hypothetical protein